MLDRLWQYAAIDEMLCRAAGHFISWYEEDRDRKNQDLRVEAAEIDFPKVWKDCESMISFVCYPKCTTCQKARKWLDENKIAYEFRDIKTNHPTLEELAAWHRTSGLPLRKFFNTSGLLYKSMDLKNKLPAMSEADMLKLLSTDGMLVKRPLLVGADFVLVGFKEADWKNRLQTD